MKKLSLLLLVLAATLLGTFLFGSHKASAFTLCDVMADPRTPGSGTDANCLGGQVEKALKGINTKAEIEAYLNSNGKNSQGSQTGGYGFQKIGAAYIKAGLGGSDWEARLENPGVGVKIADYSLCINTAYDTSSNKVVKYSDCGSSASSFIFYNKKSGKIYYAIKVDCGNPLGDLNGLPEPPPPPPPPPSDWKLSATTTSTITSIYPGQSVPFKSTLKNDNEGGTASGFCYGPRYFYSTVATPSGGSGSPYAGEQGANTNPSGTCDGRLGRNATYGPNGNTDITVTVTPPSAAYKYICGTFAFSPYSSGGARNGRSKAKCVVINQVTPVCSTLDISPASPEPNEPFAMTVSTNFGSEAVARSVYTDGGRAYVKIYGPSPATTRVFSQPPPASGVIPVSRFLTATFTDVAGLRGGNYWVEYGVTGSTAGDISCGGMKIGNPSTACVLGQPDCNTPQLTIAYKPYFTVQGGDVVAGSAFKSGTVCTPAGTSGIKSWNYDNNGDGGETGYYGAGSQAGAFASGGIASFITSLNPAANGTAVASRTATGAYTIANTGLSFSNTVNNNPALGNYGGSFGTLPCADDYASTVTGGTTTSGTFSDYSTSGTFTATSDLHLAGGTLGQDADGKGTTITIKVTGDVYIDGNILYNDGSTPTNIPRLNLYATGNIYVKGGPASPVTELHGFYVAQPNSAGDNGIFATCYDPATGSESTQYSVCNSKLTVYGAVYANTIDLDRSQGSLYSTNGPAEVFQYTPELWLSGSDGASSLPAGTTPKYDAVTSLPPVL